MDYSVLEKSKLFHEIPAGNNAIPIPESVSKWAMLMNVSRPSLHREMKRLEQQGIIAYSSAVITIHDEEALQEVLSQ